MYIMCVCLFSALSRRVGALQISIIIIIKCLHLEWDQRAQYTNKTIVLIKPYRIKRTIKWYQC